MHRAAAALCLVAAAVGAMAGSDDGYYADDVWEEGLDAELLARLQREIEAETERCPATAAYDPPAAPGAAFVETFQGAQAELRWTSSGAAEYDGEWTFGVPLVPPLGICGDRAVVMESAARRHALAAPVEPPLDPAAAGLVVQYEVRFQQPMDCGGAYLKLLRAAPNGLDLTALDAATPYSVMFGPDKCGADDKVHFIFGHRAPTTGEWEEKHLARPPRAMLDSLTHLYTLHVAPDNTYAIYIDQELALSGSLLTDFAPPVNPPESIDDPADHKPADWVDEPLIPDPDAEMPADWDESAPEMIPDPDASKPADWLDDEPLFIDSDDTPAPDDWDPEEDGEWVPPLARNPKCMPPTGCGEWVAPMVPNPAYRGKWSAPLIPNPAYVGEWKARQIPNPDHFVDDAPYKFAPIGAVAFELWTMTDGVVFDNIWLGTDLAAAQAFGAKTWLQKYERQKELSPHHSDAVLAQTRSAWDMFAAHIVGLYEDNPAKLAVLITCMVVPAMLYMFPPAPRPPRPILHRPMPVPMAEAEHEGETREEEEEREDERDHAGDDDSEGQPRRRIVPQETD